MSDAENEFANGNAGDTNAVAIVLLVLFIGIHLVAIYAGYRFIRWQLEQSGTDRPGGRHALISCWEVDESGDDVDDDGAPHKGKGKREKAPPREGFSHGQAAMVLTFFLWLLTFGWASQWHWVVFPIIMVVGFLIMARYYLKGGEIPARQHCMVICGYMTVLSVFATTAAYWLSLLHLRFPLENYGGAAAGLFASNLAVIGSIVSMVFVVVTAIAYYCQRSRADDDATVRTDMAANYTMA